MAKIVVEIGHGYTPLANRANPRSKDDEAREYTPWFPFRLKRNEKYFGIDSSDDAAELLLTHNLDVRAKAGRMALWRGNAEQLPLRNSVADELHAKEVPPVVKAFVTLTEKNRELADKTPKQRRTAFKRLMQKDARFQILREINRVLKPNGTFVLGIHCLPETLRLVEEVAPALGFRLERTGFVRESKVRLTLGQLTRSIELERANNPGFEGLHNRTPLEEARFRIRRRMRRIYLKKNE